MSVSDVMPGVQAADGEDSRLVTGEVIFYKVEKGFGFVRPDDGGADVFLHASELPDDMKNLLREGDLLQFQRHFGERGYKAKRVRLVQHDRLRGGGQRGSAVVNVRPPNAALSDDECDILNSVEFAWEVAELLAGAVTSAQSPVLRDRLIGWGREHGWVVDDDG